MSDTESFEYALWKSIDDCKIDENTDTITGSYTKSLSNQDRVVAAHIREIRDTAQQEYNRGFNDGTHSMDAEHRAVAMRLRGLRFDGGSHENLSRIAYAIYPCVTGWTCESADGLRDRLVDLMGGVSDDTCCCAGGGACAADGCDCAGEQTEVSDGQNNTHRDGCDNNSQRSSVQGHSEEVEHGGAAHDSASDSRGGSGSELVHMDGLTTYDVLDNERRKAIAELRKCDGGYTLEWDNVYEIFDALGVDYVGMTMAEVYENVRDRLIHLLGGDQPSGIDAMREMDAESDTDGTCPNDVPISSITDELRECVYTATKTYDDTPWHEMDGDSNADHTICYVTEGELLRIADRIDEQFDRICQQQEAVLQSTIDEMSEERDKARREVVELRKNRYELQRECEELQEKLEKLRDRWCQQATELMNHADAMERERDNILDLLEDARDEYKTLDQMSAETSVNFHAMRDRVWGLEEERDELQAKLDAIRDALDG